jgi:hypothetical protein
VLGQSAFVGSVCPRGELAVVPGGALCSGDLVEPGEVSPELLRCGGIADDLALALSDLEPSQAWLTRAVQLVAPDSTGSDRDVGFVDGPRLDPVLVATEVDLSGCEGEGGAGPTGPSGSGPSGSSSSGTGAGTGSGAGEPVYVEVPLRSYEGCGCSGTWVTIDYLLVDATGEEPPPEAYYVEDDGGCSADSSESYETDSYSDEPRAESCTSDTTGIGETDSSDSDDWGESGESFDSSGDCSGDTSDGSSDSSTADDCSGDTSSDSGDDCGGDTSGGSGDDCAISTKPGRGQGRVRLSVATYLLLLGVVPLRRWSKRRRTRR